MAEIKKKEIYDFINEDNDPLNTFRTILLFGRNVSTYKFAFCSALLNHNAKDQLKYSDLRDDFLKELLKHYQINPKQYQGGANSVTNAFDGYIKSDKTKDDWNQLLKVAERNIYNNVFDAFQNVGGGTISKDYMLFEHDKLNRKLVLTDNLNSILESPRLINSIKKENEARWKIVEEAWKNNLSVNMLEYVDGDFYSNDLFTNARVNLRSAVDVLLPYQKGKCFYCLNKVNRNVDKEEDDFPDVDHFFPLSMLDIVSARKINANGVWNLVVACKKCNRGESGKFNRPADKIFFDKLLSRNLYYYQEHKHSLKNSILISLNARNNKDIERKMNTIYNQFRYIEGWKPKNIYK